MKRTATPMVVVKEASQRSSVAPADKNESVKEKPITRKSSTVSSIPEDTEIGQADRDTDMPDVTDPDAGFCPTDDQPYRRLRRHTIT